jgi:hypothetical protein
MKVVVKWLGSLVSVPIEWLTRLIDRRTDRQRTGPEHAKEMDEVDATIKEWDEKQSREWDEKQNH